MTWLAAIALLASQFAYKSAKDFKTLEHFKSVETFEASFAEYEQDCLDNTGGGTGGIPCEELKHELWDREMNIYYGRLLAKLGPKEKTLLKESQRQWVVVRDNAIALNSALLDRRYDT
ncbi:MAG TPA: lysozyme inhibitor LprI family protein, partial [Thermoanaerobaculia bacterium]|nr:lysozyme inhibitor LprI family protein [Thermoanaerobaculia bacterium]